MFNTETLVGAYTDWIGSPRFLGWDRYLATFVFAHLRGSRRVVRNQMFEAVETVYSRLVTRVVRKPRSPAWAHLRPVLIAAPDRPVPKHDKQQLADVVINDGVHVHAIILIPPVSRLQEDLVSHFKEYADVYRQAAPTLRRIHAVPIESAPSYVVGYGLKKLTRHSFTSDDVLILPKSLKELPP